MSENKEYLTGTEKRSLENIARGHYNDYDLAHILEKILIEIRKLSTEPMENKTKETL